MIVYRVTVTIQKEIEDSWLKYMKDEHIKDVMNTGYFSEWKLQKQILPKDSAADATYVIEYYALSFQQYQSYAEKEATRLQNEHSLKFSGKFTASRTLFEILN